MRYFLGKKAFLECYKLIVAKTAKSRPWEMYQYSHCFVFNSNVDRSISLEENG